MRLTLLAVIVLVATFAAECRAAGPTGPADVKRLVLRVQQGDYSAADDAVRMLTAFDKNGVHWEMNEVVSALLDAKQFASAEKLAMQALLSAPMDTGSVYFYQRARVHAFLGMEKNEDALACVKGLYNVAPMGYYTDEAVKEVVATLQVARADQPELVRRFRLDQIRAASTRPSQTTSDIPSSTVLSLIKVDAKPYMRDLQQFIWWKTSSGRQAAGNLYLLVLQR